MDGIKKCYLNKKCVYIYAKSQIQYTDQKTNRSLNLSVRCCSQKTHPNINIVLELNPSPKSLDCERTTSEQKLFIVTVNQIGSR